MSGISEPIRCAEVLRIFDSNPGGVMNLPLVVAATLFLSITACATSTPERPVSTRSPEPAAVTEDTVTESSSTAAGDELQVVDVPEVEESVVARNQQSSELVCRYEKEVGSHMRTRVCRWREEIDAERKATQETLREMGRGTNQSFSD